MRLLDVLYFLLWVGLLFQMMRFGCGADVGIATSTVTDVAIESCDVTLMKGDHGGSVSARNHSAAMNNIRQNLLFTFASNLAGVRDANLQTSSPSAGG